jgi:sporulation protein YhbH
MSTFRTHKTIADRSASDRRRHREKIEKAIREGVHNIVSDESIIGQDGKKKIKIPVKGIKEYRFVYGENSKRAGSSAGQDISRGQEIGKKKSGKKPGKKPGNEKGDEFYEVEISLDELATYLFDDLELPDLEKKRFKQITETKLKRKGYRTKGIRPRLDKKKTLRSKLKRKAVAKQSQSLTDEEEESFSFNEKDLRYRHVAPHPEENSNAVIFFIMDTSGSMSQEKKFLSRSYFFLIYQFLRYRYDNTNIVFISHDVAAHEVDEEKFFKRGSSGGTLISPAIEKTLEIIGKRYHPNSWNIYAFHCSDGDNWGTDIDKAVNSSIKLKEICQMYSYCEVIPEGDWRTSGGSTMMNAYTPIFDKKFKATTLTSKADIWPAFKQLFGGKLGV